MQLYEKVYREELAFFVGRSKELELMHKHVTGKWKWQWLHLYGQSGIGKSTLLKRFKSDRPDGHMYYLDSNHGMQTKESILEQLAEQLLSLGEVNLNQQDENEIAERMNRRSKLMDSNIVLIIDAFDHWRPVEYWFNRWLGRLNATVRLITAGQNSLTGGWLRSGWASLVHTIQVQALSPLDVEHYTRIRNISDLDAPHQLLRFSRGNPLAMTLAAEVMLKGNEPMQFDRQDRPKLVSIIMNELFQGMPSELFRLLEAASVYWQFNEERLAAIIDDELAVDSFRQLIELSFVILKDDRWMLHDAVRAWVLDDFIRRKPHSYEQMRYKALEQIRLEERLQPELRPKLFLDKMNLHENPIVRTICFSGHIEGVELRECRETDIPVVQSLYTRYHEFAVPSTEEEPHMVQLLPQIWKADPASFSTFWIGDEMIATYGKVPLHNQMLKVLAKEPLLHPFINGWEPGENAFLLSFISINPQLQENIRAYIINTMLNHFLPSESIIGFTCLKEWFPVFELCGFDLAPWADSKTEKGIEYQAFILDLREEDFLTKLNRKLSASAAAETPHKDEETDEHQRAEENVKKLDPLAA